MTNISVSLQIEYPVLPKKKSTILASSVLSWSIIIIWETISLLWFCCVRTCKLLKLALTWSVGIIFMEIGVGINNPGKTQNPKQQNKIFEKNRWNTKNIVRKKNLNGGSLKKPTALYYMQRHLVLWQISVQPISVEFVYNTQLKIESSKPIINQYGFKDKVQMFLR